ncbi:male-enhanced antigen 1-like [Centruroides sculpturatus]|uniref:male-enhanced antigen 1-like n=1 Tax=Centruroides sculpturatus TaxID=218467 RepID=UPI000C6E4537|nr:male-enhanced antigen 1-like [Centruroides sculpturatus]
MAPIVHSPNQSDRPENDDEELHSREIVINNFESDPSSDEDDAIDIGGYQLLPQDTDNDDGIELVVESLFDADEVEDSVSHLEISEVETSRFTSRDNTEEKTPEEIDSCPMNQERVDKIKQAMAGFTLPCSSVPNWAFNIPEDEWKERLVTILQKKTN